MKILTGISILDEIFKSVQQGNFEGIGVDDLKQYKNLVWETILYYDQNDSDYLETGNMNIFRKNQFKLMSDFDKLIDYQTKVDNLPIRVLRKAVECSICLEYLANGSFFHQLSCRHVFHSCCIKEWLKINNTCPYCRTKVI